MKELKDAAEAALRKIAVTKAAVMPKDAGTPTATDPSKSLADAIVQGMR